MKLVIRGLLLVVAVGSLVGCGQQQPQNPNFVNGGAFPNQQFQQNPWQPNPWQNPQFQPNPWQNPQFQPNPWQNPQFQQNPWYRTW